MGLLHNLIHFAFFSFPACSMAAMFGIGTLRARQRWLWLTAPAAKSVSTSCSSTDARTSRPHPSPRQSVSQRQPHPASLLPWHQAWRLPRHSRSRTRAAAQAWVTAPPEEQCHNRNVVWHNACASECVRVYVCVCEFVTLPSQCHCVSTQASGTDGHVARCCTRRARWGSKRCLCVCQECKLWITQPHAVCLNDLTKTKGKVFSLRFTSDGKVKGIRHPLPLHSGLKECIYLYGGLKVPK